MRTDGTRIIRHIAGYAVGIFLFLVLIPFGLYWLSVVTAPYPPLAVTGHEAARAVISIPLFVAGIVFMAWSNIDLFRIGKGGPTDGLGVTISPRSQHLVVVGPYRYCRNPMVFGAYALYFAIAAALGSVAGTLVLVLFVGISIIYLKRTEERRLERDFGEEYRAYRRRVSMLLPLPPKK
ncbi:MAG TPA: isoprenylcysteine carboxylmethyltransferase family protein [Spirochaetota bacterium]|nr:isoprenylcysteine carboxylmethyltransferase family protein [Spirochaetota bacterium]